MNITLITVGKSKEKAINSIFAEYQKRLAPYMPLKLLELPHGKGDPATIKSQEAKNILSKIPESTYIIAMDERGKTVSTRQAAKQFQTMQDNGIREVAIIIGGAEGLDEQIRQAANFTWSLSPLTFPHMMVRPILAEQLYRIATVIAGHPYHRD